MDPEIACRVGDNGEGERGSKDVFLQRWSEEAESATRGDGGLWLLIGWTDGQMERGIIGMLTAVRDGGAFVLDIDAHQCMRYGGCK